MNTFENPLNIVVSGGGGGAPKIARGIAEAMPDANIVLYQGTADRGGSSKKLRDEFAIPAVGDARNGIAAFAVAEIAETFNTRFGADVTLDSIREHGDKLQAQALALQPDLNETWLALQLDATDEVAAELVENGHALRGHTYGNLVLAAAARGEGGDIGLAISHSSRLMGLKPNHRVLPASLVPHDLELHDRRADGTTFTVVGEGDIDVHPINDPDYAYTTLTEQVPINPEAAAAIREADAFIIASGSWDTSVKPPLLVDGITDALGAMKPDSKVIAMPNITKELTRDTMSLGSYVDGLEAITNPDGKSGRDIDVILFHNNPSSLPEGVEPVILEPHSLGQRSKLPVAIGGDLVDPHKAVKDPNDMVATRSSVHHNGRQVGEVLRSEVFTPSASPRLRQAA